MKSMAMAVVRGSLGDGPCGHRGRPAIPALTGRATSGFPMSNIGHGAGGAQAPRGALQFRYELAVVPFVSFSHIAIYIAILPRPY